MVYLIIIIEIINLYSAFFLIWQQCAIYIIKIYYKNYKKYYKKYIIKKRLYMKQYFLFKNYSQYYF